MMTNCEYVNTLYKALERLELNDPAALALLGDENTIRAARMAIAHDIARTILKGAESINQPERAPRPAWLEPEPFDYPSPPRRIPEDMRE